MCSYGFRAEHVVKQILTYRRAEWVLNFDSGYVALQVQLLVIPRREHSKTARNLLFRLGLADSSPAEAVRNDRAEGSALTLPMLWQCFGAR